MAVAAEDEHFVIDALEYLTDDETALVAAEGAAGGFMEEEDVWLMGEDLVGFAEKVGWGVPPRPAAVDQLKDTADAADGELV